MVLRKPYAFLIKHFKLIHIIMFIISAYITFRASNIVSFFRDYISSGRVEIVPNYYSFGLVYLLIILLIIINIFILYLMKYKNKPIKLYIFDIVCVSISFLLFIYLGSNVKNLITSSEAARVIRFLRDISVVNFGLLIMLSVPYLIRGLGFDIKKFDFNKDLIEFNVKEEDNEEVEVNVDFKTDTAKRVGRKTIRELGYYYKENKFFINIILGVVGVIIILSFPFNTFILRNKLYEGQVLSTKNYNLVVDSSYISTRNRIDDSKTYVILKVKVLGKKNKYKLNLDSLPLKGRHDSYAPSLKYYNYFTDIGYGYRNTYLTTDKYSEYILIYSVNNNDIKRLYLNYLDENKKIKIRPKEIS